MLSTYWWVLESTLNMPQRLGHCAADDSNERFVDIGSRNFRPDDISIMTKCNAYFGPNDSERYQTVVNSLQLFAAFLYRAAVIISTHGKSLEQIHRQN